MHADNTGGNHLMLRPEQETTQELKHNGVQGRQKHTASTSAFGDWVVRRPANMTRLHKRVSLMPSRVTELNMMKLDEFIGAGLWVCKGLRSGSRTAVV